MTQLSVLAKPARTSYSGDDQSISAYWFECSIGVVGVFLFMASIASLPVTGGLALGVWAATAILGPTVASFGVVYACA